MNTKDWVVCLVEPNKFEAQIIVDLLRNAGVDKIKVFLDSQAAMDGLELYPANVVIAALESTPIEGVAWTKLFRRNHKLPGRKAAIFLTSRAFSRNVAEDCRHAGANALIGKPVSGATILATIKKVLGNPRAFIDAEGYVGPCRRAGIVTAGAGTRRRESDEAAGSERQAPENTLANAVGALSKAVTDLVQGRGDNSAVEIALRTVQSYAVNAGDGPLMRACAAFTLQIQAKGLRADAFKAGLTACVSGVSQLAQLAVAETEKRDAIAESVRQAVAKAAMQKAA